MKKKIGVLFLGPLPPPYHGVSVINQTLLKSHFSEAFDVAFVPTNFAATIDDLSRFSLKKVFLTLKYAAQSVKAIMKGGIDIVCFPINFTPQAMLRDMCLLLAIKPFGKPIIFYTHGNNLPEFRAKSNPLMRKAIDFTMRMADAAILVGERLRFNYEGYLPNEKILSVHHGIECFKAKIQKTKSKDEIKILFFSNLIESKGFVVVIRAIPKVIAKFKNARFVFAGEWDATANKEEIFSFIRKHNLEKNIEWKGRLIGEEKERAFLDADIFVFPTSYPLETFGIVNLEAMQAGLPIITTGRGAIPEVVSDGKNGFIIPEQNSDALAEKIILLCENEELRQTMAETNRRDFEERYTKEKYADRMIEAVEKLHDALSS